jgi:hypothetical protein
MHHNVQVSPEPCNINTIVRMYLQGTAPVHTAMLATLRWPLGAITLYHQQRVLTLFGEHSMFHAASEPFNSVHTRLAHQDTFVVGL